MLVLISVTSCHTEVWGHLLIPTNSGSRSALARSCVYLGALLHFFCHEQRETLLTKGGGLHTFGIAVASCNSICTSSRWPTARLWRKEEWILGNWLRKGSCFIPGSTGLSKLMIPLDLTIGIQKLMCEHYYFWFPKGKIYLQHIWLLC